jgi:PBSX family phage terminase large subunit
MLGAPAQIEFGLPLPSLPHQVEIMESTAKFTLGSGAYGSGKTLTNAWNALKLALKYPGSKGLCGAETGPQLRETLQSDFDTLIADFLARGLVKFEAGKQKYTFWNGSTILFWALVGSAPERTRHKLRSLNLSWVIIEEITAIPEATVLELVGRVRNQIGPRQLFGSCNPDSPGHYLYEWFVDPATRKKGFKFVNSTYASNPYLPPDYIEYLFSTYPENIVKRYLLGQWTGVDGLVYANFDPTMHVINPIPMSKRFIKEKLRAIDFGGTDPHAILWGFEDLMGDIYITDEFYKAEESLGVLARVLHANPVEITYCDHDVADRLTLSRDYNITGLRRARKERMNGIDTVMQALAMRPETGRPRLRIFRNCVNLIRELGTYAWTQINEKGVSDHSVDCLRYLCHSKYHGRWRSGSYLKGGKA